MRMIVQQLVEWRLARETEVLWEDLPQRHFVYHKIPHYQTRARTPGRRGGKPTTNRLTAWRGFMDVYINIYWKQAHNTEAWRRCILCCPTPSFVERRPADDCALSYCDVQAKCHICVYVIVGYTGIKTSLIGFILYFEREEGNKLQKLCDYWAELALSYHATISFSVKIPLA
jgi:hypothetical protein